MPYHYIVIFSQHWIKSWTYCYEGLTTALRFFSFSVPLFLQEMYGSQIWSKRDRRVDKGNSKIFQLIFASFLFIVACKFFYPKILYAYLIVKKICCLSFCLGDILYLSRIFAWLLQRKGATLTKSSALCKSLIDLLQMLTFIFEWSGHADLLIFKKYNFHFWTWFSYFS